MSLFSTIAAQGAGSMMEDPTSGLVADMHDLASHPALGGADTGLAELLGKVSTHMSSELSGLSTKLPIMSAVESAQKRVALSDGVFPGTDGGSLMSQAFSSMTQVTPMLSTLQAQIQNILDTSPIPPTPLPGETPTDSPAALAIKSLVTASTGTLSGLQAAGAAAVAQGKALLQNVAFGSFLAMKHSPAIQEILGQFSNVPPELSSEMGMMSASVSKLKGSVIPPAPLIARNDTLIVSPPPAVTPTPAKNPAANQASKAQVDAAKAEMESAGEACIVAQKAVAQWQIANNYEAVQAAGKSPNATAAEKQAYQQLKAQYRDACYDNWYAKSQLYQIAKDDYQTALTNYTSTVG